MHTETLHTESDALAIVIVAEIPNTRQVVKQWRSFCGPLTSLFTKKRKIATGSIQSRKQDKTVLVAVKAAAKFPWWYFGMSVVQFDTLLAVLEPYI